VPRHLPRIELLRYALIGARTELGTGMGYIGEEEEDQLICDIAELERRIAVAEEKRQPPPTTPKAEG
jgi:hypothetical protein